MAYVWSKSRVVDEVKGRDTGKIHRRMNFYMYTYDFLQKRGLLTVEYKNKCAHN